MAAVDVQRVFRALAEARDKDFYPLWCDLTYLWRPLPEITFRIYQVAGTADARVALWVAGSRPDRTRITWGLGVTAEAGTLTIETSIDVGAPAGPEVDDQVFERSAATGDAARAAELIRSMAGELCAQRWPITQESFPPS
ncbi:hypothetical protein AB0C12_13665 [Actinoplanes sp. NPDC048967]|uniref:hypothetical protein n=1 Tax=Actinoplanes sp. NPDC048967 TaxID=3155269 RepID=UPI0033FE69D0